MSLSPEDKDRIEKEEAYRQEIRNRDKADAQSQVQAQSKTLVIRGCLGFIILTLLVSVCVALVSVGEDGSAPQYAGGKSACTHFRNVVSDGAAGLLTDAELREKLKEVNSSASSAELSIRRAGTNMLSAVTRGDTDGYVAAGTQMLAACIEHGY